MKEKFYLLLLEIYARTFKLQMVPFFWSRHVQSLISTSVEQIFTVNLTLLLFMHLCQKRMIPFDFVMFVPQVLRVPI